MFGKLPTSRLLVLAILIGGLVVLTDLFYWEFRNVESETAKPRPSPSVAVARMEAVVPSSTSSPVIVESDRDRRELIQPQATQNETSNSVPAEEFVPPPPVPGLYSVALRSHPELLQDSERFSAIAEEFVNKVKAAGWDTTSEQYKKAWEEATSESDAMLRNLLGEQAYIMIKTEQSRE